MQENTAEITLDEFLNLNKNECQIVDIRSSISFDYGKIDGAVNIDYNEFDETKLDKSKKIILYCKSGIISLPLAETLCEKGFCACSLKEGYIGWLRRKIEQDETKKKRNGSKSRKKHSKEISQTAFFKVCLCNKRI